MPFCGQTDRQSNKRTEIFKKSILLYRKVIGMVFLLTICEIKVVLRAIAALKTMAKNEKRGKWRGKIQFLWKYTQPCVTYSLKFYF